jgi:NAD(P)-dependent dehydrogenase (short-subunit alcohol dehydrogenase family)
MLKRTSASTLLRPVRFEGLSWNRRSESLVYTLRAGPVKTRMLLDLLDQGLPVDHITDPVPMKRMGEPEEIGHRGRVPPRTRCELCHR